jgi:hypothetical protein
MAMGTPSPTWPYLPPIKFLQKPPDLEKKRGREREREEIE